MGRLLAFLAHVCVHHPWRVVVLTLAPCVAASALVLVIPRDLSFTGILDRSHPEVARYFDVTRTADLGGILPLLLEGPDEKLDEAARALVPALEPLDSVRRVVAEPPLAWLEANAPYVVDRPQFERLLTLATHPEDSENVIAVERDIATLEARAAEQKPNGLRLVMVTMEEDPLDLAAGGASFLVVDEVTQRALAPFGVKGSYAGLPAISAQDQSRVFRLINIVTPISLLLVLLLFRIVERRLLRLALIAVPMVVSTTATLGLAGLATGSITLLESFFGVMVFGLGNDFALVLLVRMREERAHGVEFATALERTLTGSGRGVVAGALTTSGSFAIIGLAPDPTAFHLGVSGAIGILVCLILMLTLLPACWVLVEKRWPTEASEADLRFSLITKLAHHAARHPVPHLLFTVALVVVSVVGFSRFHFETNLEKVFSREVPAIETIRRVQASFQVNGGPWIVLAKDVDEAARLERAFAAAPQFSRIESIADLVPPDARERHAKLVAARGDIAAQRATYEGLKPLVSTAELPKIEDAIKLLNILEAAATRPPLTVDEVPPALRAQFIAPSGELIVYAFVGKPTLDGREGRDLRLAAQAIAPEATGLSALLEAIMVSERPWAIPIFFGVLAFVLALLVVEFRQPRRIALALAPVLVATGTTFGTLCWAGVGFNVMTTLVVPLLIGLGVDHGIHVVHRLVEEPEKRADGAAAAVGKAILLTTASTAASFATLLWTDHAGLEGIALVVCIGVPISLYGAVTTLPALARVLRVDPPA